MAKIVDFRVLEDLVHEVENDNNIIIIRVDIKVVRRVFHII